MGSCISDSIIDSFWWSYFLWNVCIGWKTTVGWTTIRTWNYSRSTVEKYVRIEFNIFDDRFLIILFE